MNHTIAMDDSRLPSLRIAGVETEGGQVVQARDAIAERIAGTLFSKLRESERRRAASQPPKTLDVYALTQKGLVMKHRFTRVATREGRAGLERALAIDPNYGAAWSVLAWLNVIDGFLLLTGEWTEARAAEAVAQAQRGLELDPSSPLAQIALANIYNFAGRKQDAALMSQRNVEVAPGDAEAWLLYGMHLLQVEPPQRALQAIQRAHRLYPLPPVCFQAMHSFALWANGRDDDALAEARVCIERAPLWRDCRIVQALVHAQAGRMAQAREQITALGEQAKGFTPALACDQYTGSAANFERCQRLVQAAGLPPP